MKKVIIPILAMFFSLVLTVPTFASETSEKADQNLEKLTENTGEIIYMDDEIIVRSFGNNQEIAEAISDHPNSVRSFESNLNNVVKPLGAVGEGGWSDITAGNSGRIVYWSVKPATLWPYNFDGFVKLRYHSGFKRDAPIGGFGALGSTLSGSVSMNQNNGGVAYLSGTAFSLTGDKYSVLPGVNVSFRAN